MSDNPIVFVNSEGQAQYRASAIYNCLSILVAARLGLPGGDVPEWMQERFDQGHTFEPIILERTRHRGFKAIENAQMETRQDIGNAVLVGHIDGLGYGGFIPDTVDGEPWPADKEYLPPEGITLLDAKAFAQSTWDNWQKGKWANFPYYAWQMTVYENALRRELELDFNLPIAMAIGLKDMDAAAQGSYVLKDFRVDVWTKPPVAYGEIVKRIMQVEKLAAEGVEAIPGKCDRPSFPCPYFTYPFHTAKENEVQIDEETIPGGLSAIAEAADQRVQAYKKYKEAKELVDFWDTKLRELVGDQVGSVKVGKAATNASSVTFYHSTYTTVDWNKLQIDFPGLNREQYQVSKPSDKISVRVNEKKGA